MTREEDAIAALREWSKGKITKSAVLAAIVKHQATRRSPRPPPQWKQSS
jgi:hypothetical protein